MKQRMYVLTAIFIGVALLMGCASTGAKVAGLSKAPDAEKTAFVEKQLKPSDFHKQWAALVEGQMFPKPKMDSAALKNVKTVAIVSYDFGVYAKSKGSSAGLIGLGWEKIGLKKEEIQKFTDTIYDELKAVIEANGITVVSVDAIKANDAYQAVKADEEAAKVKGVSGHWKGMASAHGLKSIPAKFGFMPTKGKLMDKGNTYSSIGKALGVDAVIVVETTAYMQLSGFSGKYGLAYSGAKGEGGVVINMFLAGEPKLIWSANTQQVAVPTDKKEGVALLGSNMYDFGKVSPDLLSVYKELANLLAFKLEMDRKK